MKKVALSVVGLSLAGQVLQAQVTWDTIFPGNTTSQPAPGWLRNAIIYEITPQGFNHPYYNDVSKWTNSQGFNPDSWKRAKGKLPYLEELGITVININSIYSTTNSLYVDKFHNTPSQGTAQDIKDFINEAHKRGIKVTSNINWYGVAPSAEVYKQHPDWFLKKGTKRIIWGESNSDFGQVLLDLENPEAYNYIRDCMVQWVLEYGLDGYRIDVYYDKKFMDEVMDICAAHGHPILIAPENIHKGSYASGDPIGHISENELINWERVWSREDEVRDSITRIQVWKNANYFKNISKGGREYFALRISNHNSHNPPRGRGFALKGDLSKMAMLFFGYHIPWFWMGEEFDASSKNVPAAKNNERGIPLGKFLHNYIDWDDLKDPHRQNVLAEAKRMLQFRRAENDILHYNSLERLETSMNVDFSSAPDNSCIPFIRWNPDYHRAVLVLPSTKNDVIFKGEVPLRAMNMDGYKLYRLKYLRNGNEEIKTETELKNLEINVLGGAEAILISPAENIIDKLVLSKNGNTFTLDITKNIKKSGNGAYYAESYVKLVNEQVPGQLGLHIFYKNGKSDTRYFCKDEEVKTAFFTALRGRLSIQDIEKIKSVELFVTTGINSGSLELKNLKLTKLRD